MNETAPENRIGRFLTLADAGEVLNISTAQAYALVRSGELPAIKLGAHGQWRIERAVLESYIEAMYEQARRLSLWNQSEFASVADFELEASVSGARAVAQGGNVAQVRTMRR